MVPDGNAEARTVGGLDVVLEVALEHGGPLLAAQTLAGVLGCRAHLRCATSPPVIRLFRISATWVLKVQLVRVYYLRMLSGHVNALCLAENALYMYISPRVN
jgi:hypothetical protein